MSGLSLATKGVICGGNSVAPIMGGGGGGPIRKQETVAFVMPKIKVLNLDISKNIKKYDVNVQSIKSVF